MADISHIVGGRIVYKDVNSFVDNFLDLMVDMDEPFDQFSLQGVLSRFDRISRRYPFLGTFHPRINYARRKLISRSSAENFLEGFNFVPSIGGSTEEYLDNKTYEAKKGFISDNRAALKEFVEEVKDRLESDSDYLRSALKMHPEFRGIEKIIDIPATIAKIKELEI